LPNDTTQRAGSPVNLATASDLGKGLTLRQVF
jgi:hypothetical protein